jgi:prophage maintenance system killer protein
VFGNKRTAYELVRIFIRLNGGDLNPNADDAYRFLLRVAQGKESMKDVEAWIARHLTDMRG